MDPRPQSPNTPTAAQAGEACRIAWDSVKEVLALGPMSLTGKQRRFLRAEAHALEPVIHIGKEGLSESLVGAINDALLAHELIKLRILDGCPLERDEVSEGLPPLVKADFVGLVGRVLILYKRHPHKPKIVVPRDGKD